MTPEETINDINIKENGLAVFQNPLENVGSLSFSDETNFIRMFSPDGSPWIITVDNAGALVVTADS